jgi:CheY-like chemotaxis protein
MEAIATLAGGIAHDFNNILSGIRGYAELAVMDLPEQSQTRADLNQILQATLRARELVKQILALGRRDQRERSKVDVGAVIAEALKLLRPALPAAIEVHERVEHGLWVLADAGGLHQIVMNLATNAFQAMRQISGVLDIEATAVVAQEHEAPPGAAAAGWVRLRVRDSGTGIPAELLPRIFEPYFTTKEGHSGSGLGLSVVHGLAVGYGGVIRVDSQLGKGTTFDVWLPRCEGGQSVSAESTPAQPSGEEGVLVVDDEVDVRMVCVRMLRGMGYRVVAVSSADEALSRLDENPEGFSVVLTDQNMPKTTGMQLAARIRESHSRCRIVLMTGYSEAIVGRSPEALGIDRFLSKPFTAQELSVAIRSVSDTPAS